MQIIFFIFGICRNIRLYSHFEIKIIIKVSSFRMRRIVWCMFEYDYKRKKRAQFFGKKWQIGNSIPSYLQTKIKKTRLVIKIIIPAVYWRAIKLEIPTKESFFTVEKSYYFYSIFALPNGPLDTDFHYYASSITRPQTFNPHSINRTTAPHVCSQFGTLYPIIHARRIPAYSVCLSIHELRL